MDYNAVDYYINDEEIRRLVDFIISPELLRIGDKYLLLELHAELIRKEGGKSYTVNAHYQSYNIDIIDSQAKYLRMRKGADEKQQDKIVSPMPGKVVKIPVKAGDRLQAGDIVVVIEAMKMQSNYKVKCRLHRPQHPRERGRTGKCQPSID